MNIVKRNSEQLMLSLNKPEDLPKVSLLVGGLGGAVLVDVPLLTSNGPVIFIPYAALVLGYYFLVKRNSEISAFQRFAAGLGSFMLANLILYIYIITIANPGAFFIPLSGHAWRLALMFGIGVVINGVLTFLQTRFAKKLV